jgi:aryl-alcohol dehydrogenase-like predicted oxidoreductase
VLPACRDYGMGVVSWSPLARGWLTGRSRRGQALPESSRSERRPQGYRLDEPANRRKLDAADGLAVLAEEAGLGLIHLAIAFVLRLRPTARRR